MFGATLEKIRCPRPGCTSPLGLITRKGQPKPEPHVDIRSGTLECTQCRRPYPILEGVAILVPDPRDYVLTHVKGISQIVPDSQIPKDWWDDYEEARSELEQEHIEEDLESRRVTSLYIMNHYLRSDRGIEWWKAKTGAFSPEIQDLIQKYWDRGPFSRIEEVIHSMFKEAAGPEAVELGCGVGGLALRLQGSVSRYLGIDSSFASIAIARHLALGCDYSGKIRFPEDLLQGAVSREIPLNVPKISQTEMPADYVVGLLEQAPLAASHWDLSIVLNAIDMLEKPEKLPELQAKSLRKGGVAIQSCPYIWHESVAARLRGKIPKTVKDSARAVEWVYEQAGFKILQAFDQIPWLFFKHIRQIELYSVHFFVSKKTGT